MMSAASSIVLAALLAGCGGASPEPEAPPQAPGAVQVVLTEFSLSIDPATVAPGEVTFDAENAGAIPHELVVVRADLAPDALPVAGGVVQEAEVEVATDSGPIARGETRPLRAELDPGPYVLLCNIPGHYQAGMRASLTVRG